MKHRAYGQEIVGVGPTGQPLRAGAFNEHQVRAAAGLTLVIGTVAFVYAFFAKAYQPIQAVTIMFVAEFTVRVAIGVHRSPFGRLAGWMVRRAQPQWVSARPKRFAWTLGLLMSAAMATITSLGIRGALPLSICLVCLTLMWMETALGLCLGCEIHGLLRRHGWVAHDEGYEVCASGACRLQDAQ